MRDRDLHPGERTKAVSLCRFNWIAGVSKLLPLVRRAGVEVPLKSVDILGAIGS